MGLRTMLSRGERIELRMGDSNESITIDVDYIEFDPRRNKPNVRLHIQAPKSVDIEKGKTPKQ